MKKMLSIAATLLIFLSHSALAEEPGGFYLAGGPAVTGLAVVNCTALNCAYPDRTPTQRARYRLVAGYDFTEHAGFELGYTDFGTYAYPTTGGSVKITATTLGFRVGGSRKRRVFPFGEFGIASVRTNYANRPLLLMHGPLNQTNAFIYGGVGAEVNIHKPWGVRVSIDYVGQSDTEFASIMTSLSVMAVFKF